MASNDIWVKIEEVNVIRPERFTAGFPFPGSEPGQEAEWRLYYKVGETEFQTFWDVPKGGARYPINRVFRVPAPPAGQPLVRIWGEELDDSSPDDPIPEIALHIDLNELFGNEIVRTPRASGGDMEYEVRIRLRAAVRGVLPETSDSGPSAAVFRNEIYVAWLGRGNEQINLLNLDTFSKMTLQDTGRGGVSVATFRDRLYLAWTGTDPEGTLNLMYSTDGGNSWTRVDLPWAISFTAPAVQANNTDDRLYLSWAGTDGEQHLNYMISDNGLSFGQPITLAQTTASAPTLDYIGSPAQSPTPYGKALSWISRDGNAIKTGTLWDSPSMNEQGTLVETSDVPAAICSFPVGPGSPEPMWFAWRGLEGAGEINLGSRLWVDDTHVQDKTLLGEQTIAAPYLLRFNAPGGGESSLYLFWTGTDDDRHLNYRVVK